MIEFLITKLRNYQRELRSPNYTTYQRSLTKLFTMFAIVAILADYLLEFLIILSSKGEEGYVDPYYLFVFTIALVVLSLQIRSTNPACLKISTHIFLITILFTSVRTYEKYEDFLLTAILFTTTIFIAGLITAPVYSYLYSLLSFSFIVFMTTGDYGLSKYESAFVILLLVGSFAYIFSKTVERVFMNSTQQTNELTQLYENDKVLFSKLAHKLKTPLTILRTEINMQMGSSKSELNDTERIHNTVAEIDEAIKELTSLSKMSLSRVATSKRPTDITNLINNIAEDAKILAKNYQGLYNKTRNIVFKNDHTGGKYVYVSSEQIREALLNIIDNSIIHNEQKDNLTVYITIRKRGGYYSIWVSDDGQGIPPERMKEILSSRSPGEDAETVGTHIGLRIVRNIIWANGGRFNIYSKLNKGTRVEILLPAI